MSIFGDAMNDAVASLEDVAGEYVTYTSDGVDYLNILAIPGKEDAPESPTGGNTMVAVRSVDWMIAKARLPIPEPKRGNTITRADGRKYTVASPNSGPCWQWSGPYEAYYRIQSKAVKP